MRILRISLRDFRGVEAVDAEFDPEGVTIVEGPNETGKTSLADAFLLLLDSKDSSTRKVVKEVQPIGRDVGPFVEAELSVGPYRIVYRKRWVREKMTELEIVEPRVEQLSGEAAHAKMLQILEEETDRTLFEALRYQQGVEISQAAIAEAPSLSAALDAAAGGETRLGGGEAEALFDAVERERLRYFTPGGAVTGARKKKTEELEALERAVEAAEKKLDKLEEAVERHQRIERELADLKAGLPEVEEKVVACGKVVEEVEKVERRLETARHECELAEVALRDATARREARAGLVEEAERSATALAELREAVDASTPGLEAARKEVSAAEDALAEAHDAVEGAELEATERRELHELLDLSFKRSQLRGRHERVVDAGEVIEKAELFLAGCTVDEELVEEIDAATEELAVARGRAEAGGARLAIEPLQPVHVNLDGEERDVRPGEVVEAVVSAEVEATIADLVRVVVSPPAGAGDVEEGLKRAGDRLEGLLERAGVGSRGEAHRLLHERARRQDECDNARRGLEEDLDDLDLAQLAAKVERAEQRFAELQEGRDPVEATPDAFDRARERVGEAEGELEEARSREDERQASLVAAQSALRALEQKDIEQRTRIEGAVSQAERSTAELEEQRNETPDEELERALAEATERLAVADAAREEVAAELEAGDPETARATLENERARKQRLEDDVNSRLVTLAETRTELEIGGRDGLSDRLAEARARLEEVQRDADSENGRAAAVERLHTLLSEKREAAQRAYIGPFSEKVNAYSRILYGPDVKVVVDHADFTISSRTLNGTTVPFGSLSGGAREQLAVLARLACGALVCPASRNGDSGGVPVIIDDALGYSDPDRLEKLGAALGVAGKDCQVIVLTCEPGRYRGVGGAKVVSLD